MIISPAGIAFLKAQEGLSLKAYYDVNGYSIGYGHHSPGVHDGMSITAMQADAFLLSDLVWVEAAVNSLVTAPVSQGAYDALCDFVYNEGAGALAKSTTLHLLNSGGDLRKAADSLLLWDKYESKGTLVSSPALLARRQAERAMFLGTALGESA